MQIKYTIAILASITASGAMADARYSASAMQAPASLGLAYAQATIDGLGESDLKRLVFYTNRATGALQDVIEGANTLTVDEQEKKNTLLITAVSRLADAGARSGLSSDQVADYFAQSVSEKFGPEFAQSVRGLTGGQNLRTFFLSASESADSGSSQNLDFMAALNAASAELTSPEPVVSTPVQAVVTNVPRPQVLPGATTAERDIVARVVVNQGRWEITVQQGDSLSEIASALYGQSNEYTIIFDANSAVVAEPNTLEVDTVLVLPQP